MIATRIIVAAAAVLAAGTAYAADAPPGAASCSGCHAASTTVQTPVPPLNGRPAADIVSQMAAFKSGARKATIMDRIAKGFSEEETRAIAAWYEQQK
ncbi:MAG: cytochrome C [Alphaproteobacteria bacterium]